MHVGRRNFWAVWLSLFTTAMGLMSLLPVLALYVRERFGLEDPDEVAFWASAIYGAGPLSAAVMGPIWGAVGDRYGKKAMAVRANFAIALSTALMPLADQPMGLLLLRVLQGMLAGYVAPAMALVTGHLPRYVHGRILSRLQVAMALGSFVGPLVGAEISNWFGGREALFWFASATSALAGVRVLVSATDAPPVAAARQGTFLAGFWRASRALLQSRVIPWLLLLVIVMRLGQNMLEPLVALLVRDLGPQRWILAASATETLALDRTIAVAFGVLAVAQWFCTPWWGRMADRHGPLRCLAAMSLGLALVFALMALVSTIDGFLLLRGLMACLGAGAMTLAYAAISKRVADRHRTFAFSLVQSCIQLGLAWGPMLGAFVASRGDHTDFRALFVTAALLCAAAGTGMVVLRRAEVRPTA